MSLISASNVSFPFIYLFIYLERVYSRDINFNVTYRGYIEPSESGTGLNTALHSRRSHARKNALKRHVSVCFRQTPPITARNSRVTSE